MHTKFYTEILEAQKKDFNISIYDAGIITQKFSKPIEIKDHIIYSIPFGLIGQLLHKFWIKKDLNNIFLHRKKVISDIFMNDGYKMYVTNQVDRIAA